MNAQLPTLPINVINHIEAGRRVRHARIRSGKSLRWLASQMGFTAPFVSDLERGRRNWSPKTYAIAWKAVNKPKRKAAAI